MATMEISYDIERVNSRSMLEITRALALSQGNDSAQGNDMLRMSVKIPTTGSAPLEYAAVTDALATASRLLDANLVRRRGHSAMIVHRPVQFNEAQLPSLREKLELLLESIIVYRWLSAAGEEKAADPYHRRTTDYARDMMLLLNSRVSPNSIYDTDI